MISFPNTIEDKLNIFGKDVSDTGFIRRQLPIILSELSKSGTNTISLFYEGITWKWHCGKFYRHNSSII
jgi:hypothetical protein